MSLPFITVPPGTPCFLGEGHAIDEDSVYAQVSYATGHSRARRIWTVTERVVPVTWLLEAAEMFAVDDWYEKTLLAGAREFAVEVRNQALVNPSKLWWTARWVDYQTEMLHLGRGRVSGHLFLTGVGSATGPSTGALAMEVGIELLDLRSLVSGSAALAMEAAVALVGIGSAYVPQTAALEMEISIALLQTSDLRMEVSIDLLGIDNTVPSASEYIRGASWSGGGVALSVPANDVAITCQSDGSIRSVTVLGIGGSGSCVIDVWKSSYAGAIPTVADTITASAKPTISAATKSIDTTLTGWTTSVLEGDVLVFHLESVSGFTALTVVLGIE